MPSGSNSARTMGDMPSASALATCARCSGRHAERWQAVLLRVLPFRVEKRAHDGLCAQRQRAGHLRGARDSLLPGGCRRQHLSDAALWVKQPRTMGDVPSASELATCAGRQLLP